MAKKDITIIVTEKQLRESEGDAFQYLGLGGNDKPYNGQSEISASGDVDGTYAKPISTDKVAHQRTPQYWSRYRIRGDRRAYSMREGVSIDTDKDDDGVDDFYNHDELDVLGNQDENDNLTRVPKSIDDKSKQLLSIMSGLTQKQKAMVLNRMIEDCDLSTIPYSWKKELCKKLMSNI
ncbi:MAG: hypothetical protein LUD72_04845 [Bacteroidales bacterium]|nr:hypothetical protein [Bacteroidales bacterium]